MDLKLLRDATRPEHEATEAMVPLMHADVTHAEYAAVLQRFHAVIQAWESVAVSEAPSEHDALVEGRSRCAALEADLRFLEANYSPQPAADIVQQVHALLGDSARGTLERSSRFLGAMYVVEGSTLGGQYIASHVETALGLQDGEGSRFFRGYGPDTIPKWREFQQSLRDIPDAEGSQTIAAANGMFEIFRRRLSPEFTTPEDLYVREEIDPLDRLRSGPVTAS